MSGFLEVDYFDFDFKEAPLSSFNAPLFSAVGYLGLTALGCYHVKNRKIAVQKERREAWKLRKAALAAKLGVQLDNEFATVSTQGESVAIVREEEEKELASIEKETGGYVLSAYLVAAHNIFLSVLSALMFFGCLVEMARR